MSATDKLRRMLDERGVEWEGTPGVTFWGNCSALDIATNEKEKVHLHLCCTPEQAIAATLGGGECENVGEITDFCCSECGARLYTETTDGYTMIEADEKTIIKIPKFCPNCGKAVKR